MTIRNINGVFKKHFRLEFDITVICTSGGNEGGGEIRKVERVGYNGM